MKLNIKFFSLKSITCIYYVCMALEFSKANNRIEEKSSIEGLSLFWIINCVMESNIKWFLVFNQYHQVLPISIEQIIKEKTKLNCSYYSAT